MLQPVRFVLCLAVAMAPFGAASQNAIEDVHLSTDLLPAGRSAARIELRHGVSDRVFDSNGDKRAVFGEFDGVNLSAAVFPSLAAFGPTATLGTTRLRAKISGERYRLLFGYGVSDDLTVGAIVPYGEVRNRVRFDVSGGNLAANPLFNPAQPIGPSNAPFVPLGLLGTTQPVGVQGVQRLLTDPAFGFAYKPVGSASVSGILDPVVGARWRIAKSERSSTIVTPSVRIGMTEKNDPDNLFDVRLEDGSTDLQLGIEHNVLLSKSIDIRFIGQYTHQLSDHVRARAAALGEALVPRVRTERLERKLGDILETDIELGFRTGNWRLLTRLDYVQARADDYTSPRGQDVSGLEANTKARGLDLWLGASYSSIRPFLAGSAKLPFIAAFYYRTTPQAENTIASENFYFTLTFVF